MVVKGVCRSLLSIVAALLIGGCDTSGAGGSTEAASTDENWQAIRSYLDADAAWHDGKSSQSSKPSQAKNKQPRPDSSAALIAAQAIVADASHPRFVDAAEFLLDHPENDLSKIAKATVRYHLATGLLDKANAWSISSAARDRLRERAQATIDGLSEGVAEQSFDQHQRSAVVMSSEAPTFAEAEADLRFRLRHATAGGTLPNVPATRLDGGRESLSDYGGKVVLVDFWATWCAPCVRALPKLRALHRELPADRFTLLAISVDDELETVTQFMDKEAMPWSNWHVGSSSEIGQAWNVQVFPTYILVDQQGRILARTTKLNEQLISLAKEVVGSAA